MPVTTSTPGRRSVDSLLETFEGVARWASCRVETGDYGSAEPVQAR